MTGQGNQTDGPGPTYEWNFCRPEYGPMMDLPNDTYDYPEYYYYYDPNFKCYCYDFCPSFAHGKPIYTTTFVATSLSSYLSPVVFAGGLIGNFLILAMFFTKELKTMPSKPLFQALAITDNIALLSGLLCAFLHDGYGMDIPSDDIGCKLRTWSTYLSTCVSAWLVTGLTLDRFISVNWPMKANMIRYKHRVIYIILTYILIGVFYIHLALYMTHVGYCYPLLNIPSYLLFLNDFWPWLDFTLRFAVPFVIIVCCNTKMVYNMRKSEGGEITSTKTDTQASKRLTRLFIVISTAFVICLMPININVVRKIWKFKNKIPFTWRTLSYDTLVVVICRNCGYANNAMNFLLYCIWGSKFRVALASLMKFSKEK